MASSENHYDAIVVGGGLSGLIAARELCQAGQRTLLIESRDRLGGRTNTVEFAGHQIESGGTFFDLENEPDMQKEFTHYNIPMRYTKDEVAYRTLLNGKVYSNAFPFDQVPDLIRVAYQAMHDARRIDVDDDNWVAGVKDLDIPFSEWLQQFELPRETWEYVNAWVSVYSGNLPTEVSALNIFGPYIAAIGYSPWNWYAGMSYEIEGGSKIYRDAIIKDSPGLKIRLSTPIANVRQDDGGIEFTSRSGETFTASHGVWAVPLNTWEDVEFTPALSPGKQAASKLKHIGRQHKLWMRVRGVPTGIYGISYESPFKMLVHHAQLDSDETLIFAMTEHTQLDCDDKDAVQRALQVLVPEAEVLETYYEDWINSEFSKGTWMVAPPGFLSNYALDLDRPEGRLHFAGADVNLRWLSWMVGCVVSGKKAAAEIAARGPVFT